MSPDPKLDRWMGRIDAYWEAQFRWNEAREGEIHNLEKRISALEKRVMWFAGVAAAVGSSLGHVLIRALG